MRGLVATAEAREAAAKDDMAALQAARSLLLETPRPAAAQNPAKNPDLGPPDAPRALDSSAALGAAPFDARPGGASAPEVLHDADERSTAGTSAEGRPGLESTAADLDDGPAPREGAAGLHLPARARVGALNLALASAAADGDADAGGGDIGGSAQGPEAALHAAIAEAEARRAAAKKQFSALRSVCIGAQQARMAPDPKSGGRMPARGCIPQQCHVHPVAVLFGQDKLLMDVMNSKACGCTDMAVKQPQGSVSGCLACLASRALLKYCVCCQVVMFQNSCARVCILWSSGWTSHWRTQRCTARPQRALAPLTVRAPGGACRACPAAGLQQGPRTLPPAQTPRRPAAAACCSRAARLS